MSRVRCHKATLPCNRQSRKPEVASDLYKPLGGSVNGQNEVRQTIKTRICARRRISITSGISGLGGSIMPTSPTNVRFVPASRIIWASNSWERGCGKILSLESNFRASRITRFPSEDHRSFSRFTAMQVSSSRGFTFPSDPRTLLHLSIRISGAPLIVKRLSNDQNSLRQGRGEGGTYILSALNSLASAVERHIVRP